MVTVKRQWPTYAVYNDRGEQVASGIYRKKVATELANHYEAHGKFVFHAKRKDWIKRAPRY